MEIGEILQRFVAVEDPALARRIFWLLWCYERGRLRDSILHDALAHDPSGRTIVSGAAAEGARAAASVQSLSSSSDRSIQFKETDVHAVAAALEDRLPES